MIATRDMIESTVRCLERTYELAQPAALQVCGISPERVRSLTAAPAAGAKVAGFDVGRALARNWARHQGGRCKTPRSIVAAMHREYLQLGSLAAAGAKFGRTKQAMRHLFRAHGFAINDGRTRPTVRYDGDLWSPIDGYYARRVLGTKYLLHRLIWVHWIGEIPAGHQIVFRNGNRGDIRPENLEAVPVREFLFRASRERWAA